MENFNWAPFSFKTETSIHKKNGTFNSLPNDQVLVILLKPYLGLDSCKVT